MTEKRQAVGRRQTDRWSVWDKRIRDLVIWLVTAAALVNELFLKTEPNTGIVVALLGALGVPFALKADEFRRKDGS